jgi:pimeloyl-ACP methyl ester carboxylesterase
VPIQDLAVCKQLKVPALVVVNERDPVHPAVLGETLANAIPGAALCRVASKADSESRHQAGVIQAVSEFLRPLTSSLSSTVHDHP